MSVDRTLALAVIERAILDAQLAGGGSEREMIKREALQFLTATNGEWMRSRRFWCAQAEIDLSWLEAKLAKDYGIA